MKSLITYIMEAVNNSFTHEALGMSELKEKAGSQLYIFGRKYRGKKIGEDEVLNRIAEVFDEAIGQNVIKYSTGNKYFFKVSRELIDKIKNAFNEAKISGVSIEEDEKVEKTYLYYKRVKLMETGRGSKKDGVKTEDQENATCLVFNAYMDSVENDKDFSKIGNLEHIKEMLDEKFPSHSFDNTWLECFSNQVISIVNYLHRTGNKNIASYRLARFDEKGEHAVVSRAYTNMVKEYAKIKGARRDVFDPTDVILFDKNKNKIDVIMEYCKEPSDDESANQIRSNFLKYCFKPRICMGISLKKLSKSGKIKEYNTGSESIKSLESYQIIPPKKQTSKYIMVKCNGVFNLDEATDIDKKPIDNITSITLTLRTFDKGVVAMDATVTNTNGSYEGPSLGKCPAAIWRKLLNVEGADEKKIDACIEKFVGFVKPKGKVLDLNNPDPKVEYRDPKVLDGLKKLINGALKEGPSCFPFVLIH